MDHLSPYAPVLAVFGLAVVLGLLLTGLFSRLGPRSPGAVKAEPFECGSEPAPGTARQRFAVKFYVVALLFIVFDVEIVFMYPWAVVFRELSWYGFTIMSIFAFTLALGLVYVWKKGALEWE